MLKIKNEYDRKIIEGMICNEYAGNLLGSDMAGHVSPWLQRRQGITTASKSNYKDVHKSWNAKRNWAENRGDLELGIKHWHISTGGKRFHRKLNAFNAEKNDTKGIYRESFTKEDLLVALLSMQTHLIIESQFAIPNLESHLSMSLLIDTVMEILTEAVQKVRNDEELDEIERDVIKTLTV